MPNHLYKTRRCRRMTQQELASRSGVSRSTICVLERTGGYPTVRVGARLCQALDSTFEEVFPVDLLM